MTLGIVCQPSFPAAGEVLQQRVAVVYGVCRTGRRGVRRRAFAPRRAARVVFPILAAASTLAGCIVGPNYKAAPAPVPTHYKELKGWKLAAPSDALDRGDWWAPYRDPKLALLLKQVEVSNQNVAVQAAAYEQARALIREAQAALFPTLTANYTGTHTHTGPNAVSTAGSAIGGPGTAGGGDTTIYTAQLAGTWDIDVWGKVRRQIEANTSAAQSSAADLANVKLSQQSLLAMAYFNLRAEDELSDLLSRTLVQYRETLRVTQNKVNAGCCAPPLTSVTPADLALAKAQVENTEASLINVGVARTANEHAIAMLIGRPPAELTVGHRPLSGAHMPHIPITVPSTLLERRPDIAQAERTMEQQNALIGVAEAAFYPDLSLSGTLQWVGKTPFPFNVANEIWSLGGTASEVLFEGGLRSAQLDAARAVYWQSVATYRQTVLAAFQQVEDELAAIHILTRQLAVQRQAVIDAREAVRVYTNQYTAGTIDLTVLVTGEVTLLADEEAELTIRQNLFLATVTLIEALGGTWDTTLLPSGEELQKSFSLLPKLPTTDAGVEYPPPITP
jgi:NodT family efflux transporter outer membrane factor (OMF) lipoprotein